MNRGWDIWPGKYAKTADRTESASFWHLLRNSICHNSEGISPIDLFHGSFWISFQSSFQLWDNKTCFWIILTLWSNPYMHNSCLGISPKYLIFRNAPKPIIDLCGISFLCANFETFTILAQFYWKLALIRRTNINNLDYFLLYGWQGRKILWLNSLTHLKCDCDISLLPW